MVKPNYLIMSTSSLYCKLLCASEAAYCIPPNASPGKYNPSKSDPHITPNIQRQYDAVGFTEDPFVCVAAEIEACLVGKTDYGIVISFRGTLPPAVNIPSILDWIENIFMAPPISNPNLPGEVHSGFFLAVTLLERQIISALHQLDSSRTLPIYMTGHSKGGAMVPIAAMYFRNKYHIHAHQTVRFAGPKPGNQDFANAYKIAFPQDINFENYLDIVPLLPPSDEFIKVLLLIPDLPDTLKRILHAASQWDYIQVGHSVYIDAEGKIDPNPPLMATRLGEIFLKLIEFDAAAIADAHHASCGYRYMQGVCQGNVCQF